MHILIVEGNTEETRRRVASLSGYTPGEGYAAVIRSLVPEARTDIVCPADDGASPSCSLESYRGVVITGSALTIWRDDPPVRRQIEFGRAIFSAGVPFFGSCWGLQVAAVAAGGTAARNERGREVAYARRLRLTEAGSSHPLHRGRPAIFDAPAIHADHVVTLPPQAVVTAWNDVSPVQAAEIRAGAGVFWGVQYHPEYSLADIGDVLLRYGASLVGDGLFTDLPSLEAYARNLHALHHNTARKDIAWQYGLGAELTDPALRTLEIANWLRMQVRAQ